MCARASKNSRTARTPDARGACSKTALFNFPRRDDWYSRRVASFQKGSCRRVCGHKKTPRGIGVGRSCSLIKCVMGLSFRKCNNLARKGEGGHQRVRRSAGESPRVDQLAMGDAIDARRQSLKVRTGVAYRSADARRKERKHRSRSRPHREAPCKIPPAFSCNITCDRFPDS